MVYIFAALYCEAKSLIEYYGLGRNNEFKKFQVFENKEQEIVLAITGVGAMNAAICVTQVACTYGAGAEDFFVNVGSCAASDGAAGNNKRLAACDGETGNGAKTEVFLCNKIVEDVTGRIFYPDVLYKHDFGEKMVVTVSKVLTDGVPDSGALYDMEAAGVYQAAGYFVGPQNMFFLKIVSDSGDVKGISSEHIEKIFNIVKPEMVKFVDNLKRIHYETCIRFAGDMGMNGDEFEGYVGQVSRDMRCSATMENSLRQLLRYCECAGISYRGIIDSMYRAGRLPCASKKEGIGCLNEFKERVL